MGQRPTLQTAFVTGLENHLSSFGVEVIRGNQQADKPSKPYISFQFIPGGLHPIELPNTLWDVRDKPISDPKWNFNVEIDRTQLKLLTVQHSIKAGQDGAGGRIADQMEIYWRYKFRDDADAQNLTSTYIRGIEPTNAEFPEAEGSVIREEINVVDVELVTKLEYIKEVETIEQVDTSNTSSTLPGESFS